MPQPNDLSRSVVAFEHDATVVAVIELSQSSWLVGGIVPGIDRQQCIIDFYTGGFLKRRPDLLDQHVVPRAVIADIDQLFRPVLCPQRRGGQHAGSDGGTLQQAASVQR